MKISSLIGSQKEDGDTHPLTRQLCESLLHRVYYAAFNSFWRISRISWIVAALSLVSSN